MKCNKCGSEWKTNPALSVKVCPFCGQPLTENFNINKDEAYKRGLSYYNGENVREDMERALRYFKIAAGKGESDANYYIGDIYYYGRGNIEKDIEEALRYFKIYLLKRTNKQFTANSAKLLADSYITGYGTEQNESEALRLYKLYFENGGDDPDIAMNIAIMYQHGYKSIQIDIYEAVKWFEISYQNKGNACAAYRLGLACFYGYGTDKNKNKAFRYFREVADKGYAEAQYWVADYYYCGYGSIYKNYSDAMKWYRLYIDNGGENEGAFFNVGMMYFEGWGTSKNMNQAFNYFRKANDIGSYAAKKYLGDFYYYGYGTVRQDFAEAAKFYESCTKYSADVCYNLGIMYFYGKGVGINKTKAFNYFKTAAENEHVDAQNWVGYLYYMGYDGITPNYAAALRWYNTYIDNGGSDSVAFYNMGIIYFYGRGTYEDKGKAFYYFQQAANKGHNDSYNWIGYFYYNGCGVVPQNFTEAIRWYNAYINNNGSDSVAFYNMGTMYFYGRGTNADKNTAYKYFQQAAYMGNTNAISMISYYY